MFPGPAEKLAPGGSPAAVSEVIASPSGSEAVTLTVSGPFSGPVAVAGVVIAGARSTLVTVIAVLAVPVRAFEALKVTV